MEYGGHAGYKLDISLLGEILPDGSGTYLFVDADGRIIYVGKAKNLHKRVLSYLRPNAVLSKKTALMLERAVGVDFILTSTEQEAFILESNLIKKYLPRYNIILRDDKQYPCLRLDVNEPYPRLTVVRKIKKDRAVYFGPFSSSNSVRSTHRVIDRVFKLRKCRGRKLLSRGRPCLNFQMNRCLGPCTFEIPEQEYKGIVQEVRLFLEGRNRELVNRLKREMDKAALCLDFEKAAGIRDQIKAIEKTVERQHVVSPRMEDQDVIGLAQNGEFHQVVILFVRKGYLVGSRDFLIKGRAAPASEVMEAFLKQYYSRDPFIPRQILMSEPISDLAPINAWISSLAERRVVIHRPQRGEKRRLVKMAEANADNLLNGLLETQKGDLMDSVRSVLGLEKGPRFIEGLDISNLHRDWAVGSVVSFADGLPHGPGYRNFKIRTVNGIDDYGMMAELVKRRLAKGRLPDLFLVDGGKGHLAAVKRVLEQQNRVTSAQIKDSGQPADSPIPEVIAIAKPDERRREKCDKIYVPGRKNPLTLKADHPVLLLMMRIRDEAHRRAIGYHRRLRGKNLTRSGLDQIPGIGTKRKQLLLKRFRDIDTLSMASRDDLEQIPGISRSLAKDVFSFFHDPKEAE